MKNLKKKLSPYLTFIFLAAFLTYFFLNINDFKPLVNISIGLLALVVLAKLFTFFSGGIFLKWSVEIFTGKMRLLEGVYVAVLSALGNYFGPLLGGTTIRAIYLKKVHNLSYSKFTSTLLGYYVIVFIANSILAIGSLLFLPHNNLAKSLLIFFSIWLFALVLIVILPFPNRQRFKFLEKTKAGKALVTIFFDVEEGWRTLRHNRVLILKLCGLAVASSLISLLATKVEFYAIGRSIALPNLGLYTALSTSTLLISLTPGGIGIMESVLLLTSTILGVTSVQILQVAIIDRGVSFLMLGLMFFIARAIKPKDTSKYFPTEAGEA